jgi:hypothetical protein
MMACVQGERHNNTGSLIAQSERRPGAGEGQTGRDGVAERLGVPMKPVLPVEGRGPQFKRDARDAEAQETGETLSTPESCQKHGRRQCPSEGSTGPSQPPLEGRSWFLDFVGRKHESLVREPDA